MHTLHCGIGYLIGGTLGMHVRSEFVSNDTILLSVRNVNLCVSDQLRTCSSAEYLIYLVPCIRRAERRHKRIDLAIKKQEVIPRLDRAKPSHNWRQI